ncbi:MAG: DUF3810 domain-containing protein [Firmicutes bacterium]|nr:DUF3810 domain-containing protein [Bacillota bacterium]
MIKVNIYHCILIILFVLVGSMIYIKENRTWKTIYEGKLKMVQKKYTYLKGNGVKCKIKTLTPKGNKSYGTMIGNTFTFSKLNVHKKDLNKALKLLSNCKSNNKHKF